MCLCKFISIHFLVDRVHLTLIHILSIGNWEQSQKVISGKGIGTLSENYELLEKRMIYDQSILIKINLVICLNIFLKY